MNIPRGRRTPLSGLAVIGVAVLGLTITVWAALTPPVAAQQGTGVGTGGLQIVEHGSSAGPTGLIRIVVQLPGVIAPGDTLTLSIHEPVTSESAFLATTTGDRLGGILAARLSDIDELRPDAFGLVELIVDLNPQDGTLPEEPGQVRLVRSGVYPVSIELRTSDQELVGRLTTHLIRLPDAPRTDDEPVQPLPVVLLAEITSDQEKGTALEWLAMLGRHPGVDVTASVTPEVFDLSAGTPELSAFLTTPERRELVRQPYFRVEEAGLRSAGLSAELDELLLAGDEVLSQFGTPAPPTLWIDPGSTNASEIEALYARGVRDLVVRPSSLRSPPFSPPRRPIEVTGDDTRVRSLLIDELAPQLPHDTAASAAQRLAAHLATIALTGDGQEIITLTLNTEDGGVDLADAVLREVAALPLVESFLASEALGEPLAVDTSRVPIRYALTEAEPSNVSVSGYQQAKSDLTAYRSMIRDEDTAEHDRLAEELHRSLSSDVPSDSKDTTWQRVTDFVRQQTSLVDAPPVDSINLTSRTAKVPFSFQNRSDTALRVEVRFISDKLEVNDFDDGESTTLVLEPGITTHEFTLHALSTGSFPVTIELHSPDGTLMVSQTRAAIRSTTPTGVGLGLTLGAAIFLLGWWVLDLRRRKRH